LRFATNRSALGQIGNNPMSYCAHSILHN